MLPVATKQDVVKNYYLGGRNLTSSKKYARHQSVTEHDAQKSCGKPPCITCTERRPGYTRKNEMRHLKEGIMRIRII